MGSIPIEAPGCPNLSLFALVVALVGTLAKVGAAIIGAKGRLRRNLHAHWWVVSALVPSISAVSILLIAYGR